MLQRISTCFFRIAWLCRTPAASAVAEEACEEQEMAKSRQRQNRDTSVGVGVVGVSIIAAAALYALSRKRER